MHKVYKISGNKRIFNKSGIKNHIRYYGIENKNVETYVLVQLDSVPVSEWDGSIQFYAVGLRDRDIHVLVSSETIVEAREKFYDYLQEQYPELSVSAEELAITKITHVK